MYVGDELPSVAPSVKELQWAGPTDRWCDNGDETSWSPLRIVCPRLVWRLRIECSTTDGISGFCHEVGSIWPTSTLLSPRCERSLVGANVEGVRPWLGEQRPAEVVAWRVLFVTCQREKAI